MDKFRKLTSICDTLRLQGLNQLYLITARENHSDKNEDTQNGG